MKKLLTEWFTQKDNLTWSATKMLAISSGITMMAKFLLTPVPDYLGFGSGMALLIAALAGKYLVEAKAEEPTAV